MRQSCERHDACGMLTDSERLHVAYATTYSRRASWWRFPRNNADQAASASTALIIRNQSPPRNRLQGGTFDRGSGNSALSDEVQEPPGPSRRSRLPATSSAMLRECGRSARPSLTSTPPRPEHLRLTAARISTPHMMNSFAGVNFAKAAAHAVVPVRRCRSVGRHWRLGRVLTRFAYRYQAGVPAPKT
jgi:hypothetical protein